MPVVTTLSLVSAGAAKDRCNVGSDVLRSAIVVLWDHLNTVIEGTEGWAFRFRGVGWAFLPVGVSHVGSSLWMAELLSEERSLVEWSLWHHPFTL